MEPEELSHCSDYGCTGFSRHKYSSFLHRVQTGFYEGLLQLFGSKKKGKAIPVTGHEDP
jgi:hypothetical protein